MNNDTPFTTIGDEPVEARIVAWVLGEASAFEAAELERLCEERPELMIFKRRMLALHGLLAEAENPQADESWKLPPDKRRAVEEVHGEEKPILLELVKEKRIRRSGRRAFLAIAACVLFTLIITRLQPWKQTSEAIIEVRPRMVGMTPLGNEMTDSSGTGRMTPQFFGTEFEKIKSRNSLEKVVDNLDLADRWEMDKDDAVKVLKEIVKAQNIPDTDLIKIQVRHSDKKDADDIAREVAYAYKDYRGQIEKQDADRQLTELNKAVRDQEDKVEERRKVLATIARTKGIIYKGDDSFQENDNVMAMRDQSRESAIKRGLDAQDLADAKREFETDQQLLQTMKLKQMGETISRQAPSESVVVHEVPGSEAKSAERAGKVLASNSSGGRTQPLRTDLPKELIEGTPRPINVTNLESPADSPAGSATWSMNEESQLAHKPRVRPEPPAQPTAPASSMAKVVAATTASATAVPVPDEDVTTPSLDFGDSSDFGTGWGDGKNQEHGRLAGGVDIVGGAKFETQPGLRSGDQAVSRNNIDGITNRPKRPTEVEAAGEKKMATGDMPMLGRLFEDKENASPHGSDTVTEEVRYKIDYSDKLPAPSEQPKTAADGTRHDFWDTSSAVAKGKGRGTEYELHTGYKNEYLFRGVDLGKDDENGSYNANTHWARDLGDETDGDLQVPSITTRSGDRRGLYAAEENYKLGKFDDAKREYEDVLRKDPYNAAARLGMERIETASSDYYRAAYDHTRAGLLSQVDNAWELSVPEEQAKVGVIREFQYPTEYEAPGMSGADSQAEVPKPDLTELMEEIAASEEPYSTFSLNISDASFRIAQAAIDKGERPDPAGVKVEQFYNAVDYGDPAPAAGQPVSCEIEQAAHPVIPGRNLVRVALKTAAAGRSAAQPLRLTLLVDQSGSMTRADRRAAMDTAMASLGKLLTDKDLVNIVGFSRTSRLVADGMKGDEAGKKLAELVNQSASEGGTNLETAIDLAAQMAQRRMLAGAQNRIVLFTDGAANLGDADPQRLAAKVGQLRQQGIAFDIAGIAADGLNDELLGELARKGNGRYYVVGKGAEEDFAKQLAGAFRPAAENVKVQVRFNPERVASYKLIGFEKDRLKTEDFRNDKVDAAELAAEEAGVAIYQIEPNPDGSGEIGEVSVRFRDTASGEMVERGWTIPHDAAAPAIDRATPSMQLALLSMFAAEKLKGGPLGEAIDFRQLAEAQANVKHLFGSNARVAEMLRMVEVLK